MTDPSEEHLSESELVRGFVARREAEDDFNWLRDRGVLAVMPEWVWNAASKRGHELLKVLGRSLHRYLDWSAEDLGLSLPATVEELAKARVGAVRNEGGRPQFMIKRMTRAGPPLSGRLGPGELLPR